MKKGELMSLSTLSHFIGYFSRLKSETPYHSISGPTNPEQEPGDGEEEEEVDDEESGIIHGSQPDGLIDLAEVISESHFPFTDYTARSSSELLGEYVPILRTFACH